MTSKRYFGILFIVSGAAFAATFDGMDVDGDGYISESEFVQSGLFADWDNDNDGRLDANELAIPWEDVRHWDLDGDESVDEDEFYRGAWEDWDQDQDGRLGEEDFGAANRKWPL